MNATLTTLVSALRRAVSTVTPDWAQALLFGRPMARPLRFGDVDVLTQESRKIIAPSAWADTDVDVPRVRKRRFVDVELPQSKVLRREVRLPKTPRRSLKNAVVLDMMRKTPFRPEQTVSVISDVTRNADGVALTHWVARKTDLENLKDRLRHGGLLTRRIHVAGVSSEPLADFGAQTYPLGRAWRWVNSVALVVAIVAGAWIWAKPVLALRDARILQEAERDRLTAAAVQLRREIEGQGEATSGRAAFLDRFTQRPLVLTTLQEATTTLPESVWLSDLSFERHRVTASGSTRGSAAQMLLDLPRNRLLLRPQLAGQVSQTEDGRERFDIVFQTPHEEAQ